MNKTITFGYHSFTLGFFVKLNVKLRKEDAMNLEKNYTGIATINNGKVGYRIEGVVLNQQMPKFIIDLDMMKLDAKIEALIDKKTAILNASITPKVDYHTLDGNLDLPF
jgi:hypothetical protein